jgi:hypothetical protein
VVLAGSGSFDYRDLGGRREPLVPTLLASTPNGLFACDTCLVDFDGDGAPDVPVSRIPARTDSDVRVVLDKVRDYERSAASLQKTRLLALAGPSDPAAGAFSSDSDAMAGLLPDGASVARAYLDDVSYHAARAVLFGEMNRGATWVNYVGHGGIDRLGGAPALLAVDDVDSLQSPGAPLPIVSALTCAANRFEVPGYASLGQRLLLREGGGAAAVWAATSLSLNEPAVRLGRDLFASAFAERRPTLGEAVQRALRENSGRRDVPAYLLRTYALLGDAALQLHW